MRLGMATDHAAADQEPRPPESPVYDSWGRSSRVASRRPPLPAPRLSLLRDLNQNCRTMMAETSDDVTVKGFDNPVFEDDKTENTARLNVNQATNEEIAANQAVNGSKKDHEAVNLELVTMTPEKNGNSADIKSKDATIDVTYNDDAESGQQNTHRKMVRGEKYYPGGRGTEGSTKQRYVCWGGILAVVLAVIIFIILLSTGVFYGSEDSTDVSAADGKTQSVADVQQATDRPPAPTRPPSTLPPPPPPPAVDSVFSGSLRLDEEFNPQLYDKNSAEFNRMKRTVEDQLNEAFSTFTWPAGSRDFGSVRSRVRAFTPGSVVAEFDITADHSSSMTPREASDRLQGRLQQYLAEPAATVTATDVTIRPMEDLCALGQSGCSHQCQFSYSVMEFVCLCPTGMEVGSDGKTCMFEAPAVTEMVPEIHRIEDPHLGAALHPDSTYTVDHEWMHEDGETTTPRQWVHEDGETTAEPEPEPQPTEDAPVDQGLFGVTEYETQPHEWVHEDGETTPRQWVHEDGETTPEPEPQPTEADPWLFGATDYETTPEPEPETTPEPEPETTVQDHGSLFGDLFGEPETTPEPEPETTAEPEPEATAEPEPETTEAPTDHDNWVGLADHSVHEHGETTTAEPEPKPETTQSPDQLLVGGQDTETTPEPEPESTAAPELELKAAFDGRSPKFETDVPAPVVRSIFNASMKLDEEFLESLKDRSSADFLRMTVRVKKEMAEAFSSFNWAEGDDLGQIGIKIRKFEPGSIVVYYHITTGDTGAAPAEEVADRLQRRLQDYFTSAEGVQFHGARFPVSQINIEPLRDLCATGESGCSHKCHYSAAADEFHCYCPEAMELGDDAKTCMNLHGVPPTVTLWNGQDWVHPDQTTPEPETTAEPEPETTPEPEPETTAEPEPETTAEPEPEATAEPEPEPEPETTAAPADHNWAGLVDHSAHEHGETTTPEPEPESTSPSSVADVMDGPVVLETTPEPEPETTAEPEPETTAEPEPETTAEPAATAEPEPEATTLAGETDALGEDGAADVVESRAQLAGEQTTSASEPQTTPEPEATPEPEPETTPKPDVATNAAELSLDEKLNLMHAMGIEPEWENSSAETTTAEPEPETTAEPEPEATTESEPATTAEPEPEPETTPEPTASGADLPGENVAEGDNTPTELPPVATVPAETNEVPDEPVNAPSLADDELHHGERHVDAELLPVNNSLDDKRRAKVLEKMPGDFETATAQEPGATPEPEPAAIEAAAEATTVAAAEASELVADVTTVASEPEVESVTKVMTPEPELVAEATTTESELPVETTTTESELPVEAATMAPGSASVAEAVEEVATEATAEAVTEATAEAVTEAAAEAVTEAAAETVAEVAAKSVNETTTEAVDEAAAVTEAVTEAAAEPVTEAVVETVAEAITEAATETATDAVSEAATEPVTEAVAETVTEAAAEPVTEVAAESVTEAETEAAAEAVTEAAAEAVTEATAEAVTEAAAEAVTEATAEAVTEAAAEAVTEAAAEAVTDAEAAAETATEAEAAAETATEAAAEPITEVAAEAVTEAAAEAVTEATAEAVTEAAAETVTEAAAETVTEAAAETVTEAAAENVPEAAAEPVTEAAAEAATEAAAETVPEAAVEAVTEAAAETLPEAVTKAAAEAVTDAATEAATKSGPTTAAAAESVDESAGPTTAAPEQEPTTTESEVAATTAADGSTPPTEATEAPTSSVKTPQDVLDEALKAAAEQSNDLRRR